MKVAYINKEQKDPVKELSEKLVQKWRRKDKEKAQAKYGNRKSNAK